MLKKKTKHLKATFRAELPADIIFSDWSLKANEEEEEVGMIPKHLKDRAKKERPGFD